MPDKDSTVFKKYLKKSRWVSVWYQINEILNANPKTVLEVGPGLGVVGFYLKSNTGIEYTALDYDEANKPDIVSDVREIGLPDNSYDVVCAFQVLEHIPYNDFTQVALKELRRVSKDKVIISVPHMGREFFFQMKIPFVRKIKWWYWYNYFAKEHNYDGKHYWKLGAKGLCVSKVKKDIESAGFRIARDYQIFENPKYHFFVLDKL